MKTAQVDTVWAGAGTMDNPYHPALIDAYQVVEWHDTSNAQPAGGTFTIEFVCADDVYAAIAADATYSSTLVLID